MLVRSYHSPKSKELIQKRIFGAVDGNPKAANQYQMFLSDLIPQPRKATNCSRSSFSGLWSELQKQPMTDPTNALKSNKMLQRLLSGAVDRIPKAANQY